MQLLLYLTFRNLFNAKENKKKYEFNFFFTQNIR